MRDSERPDPDQLLKHVQAEEAQQARGKLKIFLGYVAGVGKTYAMLEAARQRYEEGVDVLIAYVETHGRVETEAMLAGLEIIPRRQVAYRGITLPELDLDAVLARRPELALVDELAHSNAPGSRHAKRYMDIKELLAAGINVYTTLNIQHLESLNDIVSQITGVTVRETVPDWVMDEADEIELIDLPPDELQQRLKEGKVYVPDQAARATQRFFRRGNLTALREIALRRTAERVGGQMRAYMQAHAIPGPWHSQERILVCVGVGPLSQRLIRAARRLADEIDAEWEAIYVETAHHGRLGEKERDQVARNLRLAEELGAKTTRLPGHTVADTVIQYARSHNITKIMAGKPLHPYWLDRVRGSLVEQIIRQSGDIDIYVISSQTELPALIDVLNIRPHGPWPRYSASLLAVLVCTALGELIDLFIAPTNLVMLYLLAVVFVATRQGRGPAVLTAVLSVVAFDFFFVPPHYTFAVGDVQYVITFIGLFLVGLVISALAAEAREQAEAARRRQLQTAALYDLSRDLAATGQLMSILNVIINFMSQTFNTQVALLLPDGKSLVVRLKTAEWQPDADSLAVADWVFRQGQPAGQGTDTLPAADAFYLPFKTSQGIKGVLGIKGQLSSEQRRLLEAATNLSALAIERVDLAERSRQAQLAHETEKLQSALLNSISHDLRTPLASIIGSLSSLQEDTCYLEEAGRQELITTALEQAQWLNRLVGNLLDMSRLEANAVVLHRRPTDVEELIGVALHEMEGRFNGRPIHIVVPPDLPAVSLDVVLMSRVLINLLDNALKYSTPDTPISVSTQAQNGRIQISVANQGVGIPESDLERIFDKFYRVQRRDQVLGTGLGLAISRGIVEAHGGRIWAENQPGQLTVFTCQLPVEKMEK
jgi:two-component system sensor histidine kinase KdpD